MSVYTESYAPAALILPLPVLVAAGLVGLAGLAVVGTAKRISYLLTETNNVAKGTSANAPTKTFQTFFVDKDLLKKSLDISGVKYTEKGNRFDFEITGCKAEFFKDEYENFELKVSGFFSLDDVQNFYNDLAGEYTKLAQEKICEHIREKVQNNKAWKIEQEEVLEDNSVVITISV